MKKLHPFCIHAWIIPTYGKRDGIKGSSEATKIVHFQHHAEGTLFGRFTFCFQFDQFLTSKSQHCNLGGKERTMQYTKSGRSKPASHQTCRKPIRRRTCLLDLSPMGISNQIHCLKSPLDRVSQQARSDYLLTSSSQQGFLCYVGWQDLQQLEYESHGNSSH